MKFLSKEKISNHRYKTPEGYLICLDAIIARTGKQDYTRNELFNDGKDDIVSIDRPAKEVFSSETTSSFENKPLVDEHPNEDVNVDNHRDYSIGFVRDVRKAVVDDEDVLIANLVITDPEAIAEIESGKKTELSCGYDCDILGDEGNYYQANIRGNHVALCKNGRAGIARIVDSLEGEKMIEDKNLGQSFLKIGQKVHLDPSTNKNLTKEDLNSEYEVVGFWYNGKLVTKDPVSKEEFLGMSGIRIKNVYTNENLSVNRFQLMDSIENEEINDIEFKYLSKEAKQLKEELGLYKKQIGSHISTGKKEYFPRENQFKNQTVAELNESINEAIDNLNKGITNPSAWYRLSQHLDAWSGNPDLEKIVNKANIAIKKFIKYLNVKNKDSEENKIINDGYKRLEYDDDIIEVYLNGKKIYKGLFDYYFSDPDDFDNNFKWTGKQYESQNKKGKWVIKVQDSKTLDSINNSDKLIKLTNIIKMISDSKVKDSPITTNVYVEEDIVYDFRDVRSLVKKYNCEVVKKVDKYPGYFRGSGGIYKVLVSGEKKDLNRLVTENYPNVYFDDKKKTL